MQIVISDGLNAKALMEPHHLHPYLKELKRLLQEMGLTTADEIIVVKNGRVRLGYQIGRILFGVENEAISNDQHVGVIHIIGERPGTMHHNFSAYIAFPRKKDWPRVDHDVVKLVSGISDTALNPQMAAQMTIDYLKELAQ